jgi:hypothetical protein
MSESVFDGLGDGTPVSLDFDSLRNYGIELLQKMAGDTWTDYNLHDPGVTILEALCYAITDLAYQSDFDISDLLSNKEGDIDYRANSFFHKHQILTTNPVTTTDYRKALIDEVDDIDNAWVTPITSTHNVSSISGLYNISVQLTPVQSKNLLDKKTDEKKIIATVRKTFVSKRNLCEDVNQITILKPVKLNIRADIQLDSVIVPEVALANIYYQLQLAVNRPTRYSTEHELLKQGYTIDEIYCGPALVNGIINNDDLHDRQTVIEANDLIRVISRIDGVVLVKSLLISRDGSDDLKKQLKLKKDEVAFIDVDIQKPFDIRLIVDKYRIAIRKNLLRDIYQNVIKTGNKDFVRSLQKPEKLRGTYRDASSYYSIQNYFPYVYGIGPDGLPSTATNERKAQAKQLKAYLMIFEQVLANYLAQLDAVDTFFSNRPHKDTDTYYANPLYNVPGVHNIIKAYTNSSYSKNEKGWKDFMQDTKNAYIHTLHDTLEPDSVRINRKSRMFDHLLARFSEAPVVYPVTLYYMLYHNSRKTDRITRENEWKASVLHHFDDMNYNRIRGFNYLDANDTRHYNFVSKMHKLLYIDHKHHSLTSVFDARKIKFEKQRSASRNDKVDDSNVIDETAWNPEMENLVWYKDEAAARRKNNEISDTVPGYGGSFIFTNKDISVFKNAINMNNYRIAEEADGSYSLLYKSPNDVVWGMVSRFPALNGPPLDKLKKLVAYLIDLSRNSEGFYLIEHVLLRPDLDIEVYGFQFCIADTHGNDKERIIFRSNKWLTFEARKDTINKLLKFKQGADFEMAHLNKVVAANNAAFLIQNALAWGEKAAAAEPDKIDIDAIDNLISDAEKYYRAAQGALNSGVSTDGDEDKHDHITGNNLKLANTNIEITSVIKEVVNKLPNIADRARVANNQRLSMNDRAEARRNCKMDINDYCLAIKQLVAKANQQQRETDDNAGIINNSILLKLSALGEIADGGNTYQNLKVLFNSLKDYSNKSYPRLKMLVKGDEKQPIDEAFFSFTISVLFPEWPSRFQDVGFKACVETLFKYHAPANIKINIKWLSVKKMRHFEPLYSTWKQNLLTNNNNYGAQHIIAFLNKEHQ